MTNYGYTKKLNLSFDEANEKVRASLKDQGFGILTEIDVQATLKEKIDKDIDKYLILGACNPPLASQALDVEPDIGLFLPCNVILYSRDENIYVSAMLPSVGMSIIDNPELKKIAQQAEEKLKLAIDNL